MSNRSNKVSEWVNVENEVEFDIDAGDLLEFENGQHISVVGRIQVLEN